MASRVRKVCTLHAPLGKSIGIEVMAAVQKALREQGYTAIFWSPPTDRANDLTIMARVPDD